MDGPRWIIILIFVNYLNSVSLQPKVVYKPTEYQYSRCFEHGTNRVTCEKLNFSKERQEKQSVWPPGPYSLPPTIYGCPESESRGWFKSNVNIGKVVFPFCVKYRNDSTLDQGQWIPGTYSIFKAGPSCPTGFEESSMSSSYEFILDGQVPNIVVIEDGLCVKI
ncbi:uncharacterized protein LOC132729999 [Ruditapes philippinarum]|uniref:uncharacterized protein LOC132729999 n=1 Tax=Ruditapes philippinarum TaxID=129788 RepID=UPI00295B2232|nr:uncharacterized protein LOC132729999 [Ruditapes philippinarum]